MMSLGLVTYISIQQYKPLHYILEEEPLVDLSLIFTNVRLPCLAL